VSLSVKADEKSQKAFAFVCYNDSNGAENAIEKFNNEPEKFMIDDT